MAAQYDKIEELLRTRADLHARLNLMPYDGTPEIKERGEGKYLLFCFFFCATISMAIESFR